MGFSFNLYYLSLLSAFSKFLQATYTSIIFYKSLNARTSKQKQYFKVSPHKVATIPSVGFVSCPGRKWQQEIKNEVTIFALITIIVEAQLQSVGCRVPVSEP